MKKFKKAICLISSIFAISATTLTANALTGSGSLGDSVTWNVENKVAKLNDKNGNWSAECKDNTIYVKGKKLESTPLNRAELSAPENKILRNWLINNVIFKVYLDVNEVDAMLSIDSTTDNITQVTIGKNVNKLSGSCKINNESLKNIVVLADNIDLEGTNIGFDTEGEPIADVIIYGYEKSTALDYAENNGFEFMQIGDISYNGEIDLEDAVQIAKYIINVRSFDTEEAIIADYDGDNTVDLSDAVAIAKEILRKLRKM